MDAKITKERLSRLFSFEWVKILSCVLALIFGWLVIFELTEARISPSQKFTVFNHMQNRALVPDTIDKIDKARQEDVFSYEVLKTDYQDLAQADLYAHTTLESLLGVSDGDVILVPNNPNELTKYEENGETKYKYTYPESLVNPYRKYMTDLDPEKEGSYFYELEAYLNTFYTAGWENKDSIDTAKIEAAFRNRAKENKDKRYNTEKRIRAAIPLEIERIQKYRDALEKFYGFLNEGLICFNERSSITDDTGMSTPYEGILSVNICPDESKMRNLKQYFSYMVLEYDEAGELTGSYRYSAKNMSVVFFYNPDMEKSFEYESLLYVVDLIEKGKTPVED